MTAASSPHTGSSQDSARPKRLLWATLAALAAVGAIAAIVYAVVPRPSAGQGPLIAEIRGVVGIAQPAGIGQTVSVSGPFIVKNTGSRSLVLDRVELVGLQPGIYRGAYALAYPDPPYLGSRLGYHVPQGAHVLPGVTVAPHTEVSLVLGLKAERGDHTWSRVDVVYHVGDTTYRRHAAFVGAVCAPVARYRTSCHMPLK